MIGVSGDFLIRAQFLCSFLILEIFHPLVIVILVSTPNVVKAQSFDFSGNTAQLSPAVWVNIVTLQFPWGIWWSFSSPLNLGRAVLPNPGFLQGSQLQFPISCAPDHTSCHYNYSPRLKACICWVSSISVALAASECSGYEFLLHL